MTRGTRLGIRLVFAGLVIATVVAFFVAQRLKRTLPVVSRVEISPRYVSPNDDGRKDKVRISFGTRRADNVTVAVVNDSDDEVRRLATDEFLLKGKHEFSWNGRDARGKRVLDGVYHLRVGLRREGRTATDSKKIFVDSTPPKPVIASVSPDVLAPRSGRGAQRVRVRIHGPMRAPPMLLIYRTTADRARLVARATGSVRSPFAYWDGLVRGRPAPPGSYLIAVRTEDAAGNAGTGPPQLPPRRAETRGHPGITVSYASVTTPKREVFAGGIAHVAVARGARTYRDKRRAGALPPGRYRWRLRRLGSIRAVARGAARRHDLAVRVPRGRSGLYVLDVVMGGHKSSVLVPATARKRAPVLVVLPYASWQARNPVDSNGNGWPDLLGPEAAVSLDRPFAHGFPPQFEVYEGPFFRWLVDAHVRFDLATDLTLQAGQGARLGDHRAIVFAGPELFATGRFSESIRRYVEEGGDVAMFGDMSFRRTATLAGRGAGGLPARLAGPSLLRPDDVFGERLAIVVRDVPGSIAALRDRVSLFAGLSGSFGEFTTLEQAVARPAAAKLLASAGDDAGHPAMVLYKLGRGRLFRTGSREWNLNLATSVEAGKITERVWKSFSR